MRARAAWVAIHSQTTFVPLLRNPKPWVWSRFMISEFWNYVWAIGYYWFAIMVGYVLVATDFFEFFNPRWRHWLDRNSPPQKRRAAKIAIMVIVVFFAGFQAWREEYDKLEALKDAQRATLSKRDYTPLSSDQRKRLFESLSSENVGQFHVTINSEPNCNECEDLVQDLRDVAHAAKWDVSGGPLMISDEGEGGIRILTKGTRPTSSEGFALALWKIGIEYKFGELRSGYTGHQVFGPGYKQWEDYVVLIARHRNRQN